MQLWPMTLPLAAAACSQMAARPGSSPAEERACACGSPSVAVALSPPEQAARSTTEVRMMARRGAYTAFDMGGCAYLMVEMKAAMSAMSCSEKLWAWARIVGWERWLSRYACSDWVRYSADWPPIFGTLKLGYAFL